MLDGNLKNEKNSKINRIVNVRLIDSVKESKPIFTYELDQRENYVPTIVSSSIAGMIMGILILIGFHDTKLVQFYSFIWQIGAVWIGLSVLTIVSNTENITKKTFKHSINRIFPSLVLVFFFLIASFSERFGFFKNDNMQVIYSTLILLLLLSGFLSYQIIRIGQYLTKYEISENSIFFRNISQILPLIFSIIAIIISIL